MTDAALSPRRTIGIGKALGWIAILSLTFWSGMLGLWTAARDTPTVIVSATAEPDVVRAGEDLQIRYLIDRRESCPSTLERMVVDSAKVRFLLDDIDYKAAPGPLGRDEVVIRVPVSPTAAPGPAVYRAIVAYYCNPVHHFWPVTGTREVRFTIAPPG